MKTLTDIKYTHSGRSIVALGCFDGVHKAHAAVIETAVKFAKESDIPSIVWSFAEPPRKFYSKNSLPLLSDAETKERLIAELGADILLSVKFDEEIASVSAEDFFYEYMVKRLGAAHIVCGYNFTFGKGGLGNTGLLIELCKKNGVGFTSLPSYEIDGVSVSSSAIRTLLACGELDEAYKLLGHNYTITNTVVNGKHLGRRLGFPTINQALDDGLCPLANGVYLTRISFDQMKHFGITNIGNRPTVNGTGIVAETNIFDFSDDLYDKKVTVEFLKFIRPERKFDSVDALSSQVHKDINTAKELANKYK